MRLSYIQPRCEERLAIEISQPRWVCWTVIVERIKNAVPWMAPATATKSSTIFRSLFVIAKCPHGRWRSSAVADNSGAVSVGVLLAERMKKQGHGQIVVFSSVAGEMVRRSNFVYGSSKAGTDGFYRMLGEALRGTGVNVLTVRPGQARTNMTEGLEDAPLTVNKSDVAKAISKAVDNKKTVIWVHPLFQPIMFILKHLPLPILRKLPI